MTEARPIDASSGSVDGGDDSSGRSSSNPLAIIAAMAASAVVSHALARSTFPILLPAIETELLSNRQQSGLLGSANFVAYLVGVAVVTVVSGRVEPIRLLISGLVAAGAGFVLLATADGMAGLAAGQALTGLGSAGIWMSGPAIATGAAPPNRRGMVMGLMSSAMGFGILLAGQGTNLLRQIQGDDQLWRPTFIGAAIFAAVVLAVTTVLSRVPGTEPIEGGVSIERLRTVPRWVVLSSAYWLFGLVSSSFPGFFGLLLKDHGFTPGHITNLFSVLGLAAVLGAVNLGRVSDRVGRRPVLTGSMVAIGAAAALALVGREPFAAISIATFGAASFTFPGLTVTYLRDHLEDRAFSNALGALTLIYGTGLIIGPGLAGTVADTDLGVEAVFVGLCAIALLSAAIIAFLPRNESIGESIGEPSGASIAGASGDQSPRESIGQSIGDSGERPSSGEVDGGEIPAGLDQ
ncbi:MAG: MFS transporter [Acidimicrobiales bacterium]